MATRLILVNEPVKALPFDEPDRHPPGALSIPQIVEHNGKRFDLWNWYAGPSERAQAIALNISGPERDTVIRPVVDVDGYKLGYAVYQLSYCN